MTKTAQEILDLIENVDPNDSNALDEIDARAWCFINKQGKPVYKDKKIYNLGEEEVVRGGWTIEDAKKNVFFIPRFTRSRDALKSIRPKGWDINVNYWADNNCTAVYGKKSSLIQTSAVTEELAELHAIIKAIDYERNNNETEQ